MSQITSPIILDATGRDIVDAIESLSNRANDIENFTSSDVADGSATAWTSVTPLASGEVHSSIFAKISQMFKNIRYLYKMLGTTNISSIGVGTVTGAISALNSNKTNVIEFQKTSVPIGQKSSWDSVYSEIANGYAGIIIIHFQNGANVTGLVYKNNASYGSILGTTDDDNNPYFYAVKNGTSALRRMAYST